MRRKLQGIDEDTHHHDIAQLPGAPHQFQVSGVEIAHGGRQSDALAGIAMTRQQLL